MYRSNTTLLCLVALFAVSRCARTSLDVPERSTRCEARSVGAIPSVIELHTVRFTVDLRLRHRPIPAARNAHGTLLFRERSGAATARVDLGAAAIAPFDVTLTEGEYDVEHFASERCADEVLPCIGGRIAERIAVRPAMAPLVIDLEPRRVSIDIEPIDFGADSSIGHVVRCAHGSRYFGPLRTRSNLPLEVLGPTTCRTWRYATDDCLSADSCTAPLSALFEARPSQTIALRESAHRLGATLDFSGQWQPTRCTTSLGVGSDDRHWSAFIHSASGVVVPPALIPDGTYEIALGAECSSDDGTQFRGAVFATHTLDADHTARASLDLVRLHVDLAAQLPFSAIAHRVFIASELVTSVRDGRFESPPTSSFDIAVSPAATAAFIWWQEPSRFDEDTGAPTTSRVAFARTAIDRAAIARGRLSLALRANELLPAVFVDGTQIDQTLYTATLFLNANDRSALRITAPDALEARLDRYVSAGAYRLVLEPTMASALADNSLPQHTHSIDWITVDDQGHSTIRLFTARTRGAVLVNGAPPPDDSLTIRVVSTRDARSHASIPVRGGSFDAVLFRDEWRTSVVGQQCTASDHRGQLCGEVLLRSCPLR
ncbi:MAG: hypothetical protein U0269_28615 [Polyangiales bacterium]